MIDTERTQKNVIIQGETNNNGQELDYFLIENYAAKEGMKMVEAMDGDVLYKNWFRSLKSIEESESLPDAMYVGSVEFMQEVFKTFGIEVPDIDYPDLPNKFYKRSFEKMTYDDLLSKYEGKEKFVKPVSNKKFTGLPLTLKKDAVEIFIGRQIDKENDLLWVCDPMEVYSEWRVYVWNGTIRGVHPYGGIEMNKRPFDLDVDLINEMVEEYKDQPCAYSLDVGVTEFGTALIEVNDAWALGHYGLDPYYYFRMLEGRWGQIKALC